MAHRKRAPARGAGTIQLELGIVDLDARQVRRDDGAVELSEHEARLLAYLRDRPGEDVPREALYRDVWGHDESRVTRAVDFAIRRLRIKIERDPANPTHLVTVYGVGYRFEPLHDLAAPRPSIVREPANSFVGRDDEMGLLRDLLGGPARCVTVFGPAGVGKSRLLRRFARTLEPAPPGGVWLLDLGDAPSGEFASTLSEAVRAGRPSPELPMALDALGDALLIVDNLDGADAPGVLATWLAEAPRLRAILGSREILGLPGEHLLELSPLPVGDAAELFSQRATAAGSPRLEDRREVERLVHSLDRLPLAIELAAARTRVLSPRDLLERLDRRLGEVSGGGLSDSLRATWELLDEDERGALRRCAVFAGGFDLAAAEAVLEGVDPGHEALDLIERLRDRSLLEAHLDGGGLRFGLLRSVAALAGQELEADEERDSVLRRHARWYVGEARAGGRAVAEAEARNLRAAADRLFDDEPELAAAALLALSTARGPARARAAELARAEAALAPTSPLRAEVLIAWARCLREGGAPGDAEEVAVKALVAADAVTEAAARTELGLARWRQGAVDGLEQLRRAAEGAQRPEDLARACQALGEALASSGDRVGASEALEDARVVYGALGDRRGELCVLLALTELTVGGAGLPQARDCVALAEREGDRALEAPARLALGLGLLRASRPADARGELAFAARVLAQQGDPGALVQTLVTQAEVELEIGATSLARRRLDRASDLARRHGLWAHGDRVRVTEGRLFLDEGAIELALAALEQPARGSAEVDAARWIDLGSAQQLAGDFALAESSYQAAIELEPASPRVAALARGRLGGLLREGGRADEAEELFAEARRQLVQLQDASGLAALRVHRGRLPRSGGGTPFAEVRLAFRMRGWGSG